MKTVIIPHGNIVPLLHEAISVLFNCPESEIHSQKDTHVKKVAVFMLCRYYGYNKCDVARPYLINCLYVPTVVDQYYALMGMSENFKNQVQCINDYIQRNYDGKAA